MDIAVDRVVQAYADSDERLHCMKCQKALHTKDVGMFIRSSPDDAFSPWCPGCTWFVMHNAVVGLGIDPDGVY